MDKKENDKIYLRHIIDGIEAIEEYTDDFSEEEFSGLREKQDAVVRRLEIIGEASNNLSKKFTKENNHIEWPKIISMRNLLIHEYFGVDLAQVWLTVKNDLPKLKKAIEKILKI